MLTAEKDNTLQMKGNSGIMLQSRYEVQVLDCEDNPTYGKWFHEDKWVEVTFRNYGFVIYRLYNFRIIVYDYT